VDDAAMSSDQVSLTNRSTRYLVERLDDDPPPVSSLVPVDATAFGEWTPRQLFGPDVELQL